MSFGRQLTLDSEGGPSCHGQLFLFLVNFQLCCVERIVRSGRQLVEIHDEFLNCSVYNHYVWLLLYHLKLFCYLTQAGLLDRKGRKSERV